MSHIGVLYRVSTFGESHGVGVGCIIDGVPPNMALDAAKDIQPQLTRRRPGQSKLTTQRQEQDRIEILSGVENGITLGTPIAMMVKNLDQRKFDYANTSDVPRPGHADYTYQVKYGVTASSGGGRSSARETIARVAAGAVAEKWLFEEYGTHIVTWVSQIGGVKIDDELATRLENCPPTRDEVDDLGALVLKQDGSFVGFDGTHFSPSGDVLSPATPSSSLFTSSQQEEGSSVVYTRCPHPQSAALMAAEIQATKAAHDSTGGIVTTVIYSPPIGIGEPCFDKIEADLAKAMMSLPATKGFEIGSGFKGVALRGSQHNDKFVRAGDYDDTTAMKDASSSPKRQRLLKTLTNHAGGTLGGVTNGAPIVFRVAVKPVSSIGQEQHTAAYDGSDATLAVKGRHDPCVLPRTPPLIEGMAAIVIADATLRQRARAGPTPLHVLPAESAATAAAGVSSP